MSLNAFDLLMIVFLLIGIIYGAFRGATKQMMGLFSVWLGLIICLWLYIPFSRRILKGLFTKATDTAAASNVIFDTFSFIMLLIIFAATVQFIFIYTTKSPEEKRDKSKKNFTERAEEKSTLSLLNLFGGLITGFIVTLVWLSVFMAPFRYAIFSVRANTNFLNNLRIAMSDSTLIPYFKLVLSWIYLSIQFFIPPTGLPIIFRGFLGEG